MKRIIVFYILLLTLFSQSCNNKINSKVTREPSKPNIIFILADDLGYGDLGINGQQKIETPHIDKMANEGMQFTQFYCGTSVCAPSRSSLMTGLHTGHTPIRGNKEIQPEGQFPLKAEAITVAEVLKQAGYVTANFGKWGLGFVGTEGDPLKQGFDKFYGYNCQREAHNYFPDHLWNDTVKVMLNNTKTEYKDYAAEMIQEKALEFLSNSKTTPFFLYLTYTLPHAGLQLPNGDKLFDYYKKKFNETPVAVSSDWGNSHYQPQAYPQAAYAAMVGKLDGYVGQVLEKIKQLGIEKNTIIIFASDNGPHTEGGYDPDFFNSRGGLRGNKRSLYEGGIKTPFIVHWPDHIKPGINDTHIGAFWDVLPTMAELAHQKPPTDIDGISFLPSLLNKKQKPHEYLYWEFHEQGGRQAVRMGMWKAIRQNAIKNPEGIVELYDLEADESEKKDVANQYPEIADRMKKIMATARTENNDYPFFKK